MITPRQLMKQNPHLTLARAKRILKREKEQRENPPYPEMDALFTKVVGEVMNDYKLAA